MLALAALYFREKKQDKCDEVLLNYIKAHPDNSLQCQLTLAHVPLLRGDISAAIQQLQQVSLSVSACVRMCACGLLCACH